MNIETVKADSLHPLETRVTYAFATDLIALESSLLEYGWVAPLVVRSDGTIIDGHARWMVAQQHARLARSIPVVHIECSDAEALLMHIRLNRARGQVTPSDLSLGISELLDEKAYERDELCEKLGMVPDEFDLLADGSVIKALNIPAHEYSEAWIPVQSDDPADLKGIAFERPPNPDR